MDLDYLAWPDPITNERPDYEPDYGVASGLPKSLSHRKPIVPAVSEAKRIAIFEAFIVSVFPTKARLVMKNDIVNPIPPRIPAPEICRQFKSGGKRHMPLATATKHRNVTPKGLPRIKPAVMPTLFVLVTFCIQSAPTKMPVFASAKIGKMMGIADRLEGAAPEDLRNRNRNANGSYYNLFGS